MSQVRTEIMDSPEEDTESNEERVAPPWRSLLETAARARWRASTHNPPFDLADEQFNIVQNSDRSSKQLRRTHKMTIKSHTALVERRERERRRAANGRRLKKDSLAYKQEVMRDTKVSPIYYGPEQSLSYLKHRLLPNFAIIKRVLTEASSLLGPSPWEPKRVIDFGIGCGSASAAALDVFDNSVEWVHGVDPSQSMRDASDLILQRVSKQRSHPPRITLGESLSTERSSAGSAGGFDLAICAYTATELPHVASVLTASAVLWEKLRPNGVFIMIEPGTPDGFNSVRAVRDMLLECCPPNQTDHPESERCFVLAPCTHNGTCPMERHQRAFSRKKVSNPEEHKADPEVDEEFDETIGEDFEDEDVELNDDDDDSDWADIQAKPEAKDDPNATKPGGSISETDVFNSAYCSFVHTFPGGSRLTAKEKFSYLVVQKRVDDLSIDAFKSEKAGNPLHMENVTEVLAQTYLAGKTDKKGEKMKSRARNASEHARLLMKAKELQADYNARDADKLGLEVLHGDENRKSFGRIIRAPIKKRGHVLVDYCSAGSNNDDGHIVRHRVSKGWSTRVAPGLFSSARKARWGGFWPDLQLRVKEEDDSPEKKTTEGKK